jgi:hypothetical protein
VSDGAVPIGERAFATVSPVACVPKAATETSQPVQQPAIVNLA